MDIRESRGLSSFSMIALTICGEKYDCCNTTDSSVNVLAFCSRCRRFTSIAISESEANIDSQLASIFVTALWSVLNFLPKLISTNFKAIPFYTFLKSFENLPVFNCKISRYDYRDCDYAYNNNHLDSVVIVVPNNECNQY